MTTSIANVTRPHRARVMVMAIVTAWLAPSMAASQPATRPPDESQLRVRLDAVASMARTAIHQCEQIEAGCQDVWCRVNPAFDAGVAAWPEAVAVGVFCEQYHPEGDQSSVRELEPTLGDVHAFPRDGWITTGVPATCDGRGRACREISIGRSDDQLAQLHVAVPYGTEHRFVEAIVLVARGSYRADHSRWVDPRPPPRADATVMEQRLAMLEGLARSLAPSCGASLGEPGPRGAPLDLARTPIATWREWPNDVDVSISCSHATGPATTSGWLMASRGSIAFAGGTTVPWGDPGARCIRPGPPCAQYTTVAEDPRLVMFEVDVRTPGDRGFVRVMVHLHTAAAASR
jgi:hypothetical protein